MQSIYDSINNNQNTNEKIDKEGIILGIIFVIFFGGIFISPVIFKTIHHTLSNNAKITVKKEISKIITQTKKKAYSGNIKNGKKNYNLFLKYNSNPYNYKTKRLIKLYLKKAAYDRYLPAEIIYIKYLPIIAVKPLALTMGI